MTYHMSRVAHWVQNESVNHYPTNIERQLRYPPFAEFAVAQLQALSGGDRLANMVQFAAFVGCIVAASQIAARLGAGRVGQWLAAVLVATIPMAVVQSSGTQNDLVVAYWIACTAAFVLTDTLCGQPLGWFLIGASLGLALLTKFTAYIYAVPIVSWYLARTLRDGRGWRRILLTGVAVGTIAVVLNAGHYVRTIDMLHRAGWQLESPDSRVTQGPSDTSAEAIETVRGEGLESTPPAGAWDGRLRVQIPVRYVNQVWDPQALLSNVTRNAGLHLVTPSEGINRSIEQAILALHRSIGTDVNDPGTTYPPNRYLGLHFSTHEDDAGNLVHFLLVLLVPVLLVFSRSPQRRGLWEYGGLLAACAVLFCAVLKWQPWHSRLHVALFVLVAPLVAVLLAERIGEWGIGVLSLLLVVSVLPWLLWNVPRPILGDQSVFSVDRVSQYFTNRPNLKTSYQEAASMVRARRCTSVAFVSGGNDWEYPLWILLRSRGSADSMEIRHVHVRNTSQFLSPGELESFQPCAIISLTGTPETLDYRGVRFSWAQAGDGVSIYFEDEPQ
jgi:hypothetical protein